MKRIEDAPKELKQVFEIVFQEWLSKSEYVHQAECEHFFLKGFDVAMATGKLPQKPKRTISHLIKLEGQIYAISSDGRLFINHYLRPEEWIAYPDLPQD